MLREKSDHFQQDADDLAPNAGLSSSSDCSPSVESLPRDRAGSDTDELTTLLYNELRRLAHAALQHERPEHTLQTTSLVHEAYLRLSPTNNGWSTQDAFFAAAANTIRRVLVDHARQHNTQKRNEAGLGIELHSANLLPKQSNINILALEEALERLAAIDPPSVRVVELRFFAGLSEEKTAQVMQLSRGSVTRLWRWARSWLSLQLEEGDAEQPRRSPDEQ